ncbi:GtrA family protein [Caballeronia sp. LZ062]|uniref:GtrA family protein n=1 Tax=unclassified Caballeronia TaxID=2646786 RepID=UPI00285D0037|nr:MULTISPECIES: GtrA family protein [unclassified Caballeronia]MDR5855201.1 GtrA family protein [Caballeronia sp. LZ050]MDR5870269.1 GtrA family protein [Caballeronia sp. LZ062]
MLMRFGLVSGLGWLIDFCLFGALTALKAPVWMANTASATAAVLFVFFVSVRRVFQYHEHYLLGKLLCYVVYQAIAILAASFAIDLLTHRFGLAPIVSKILVTPFTFYCNFQFMSFITTGRLRLR